MLANFILARQSENTFNPFGSYSALEALKCIDLRVTKNCLCAIIYILCHIYKLLGPQSVPHIMY